MNSEMLAQLRNDGFLTRVSRLRQRGHSLESIRSALARNELIRVARDWIATDAASQLAIIAVANGGKLTGPTALASSGMWDGLDRRIHVARRPNAHGAGVKLSAPIAMFAAPRLASTGLERHWRAPIDPDPQQPPWRVSTIDALLETAMTVDSEQFVACLDSALHLRAISHGGLPLLISNLPNRKRRLVQLSDASAESGLESVARLRLTKLARTIESQVRIPGIARGGREGRVDLLLDKWLVVELDGDAFHDTADDRDRNSALVRRGYRIHRFGFTQVFFGWPQVEATVRELLRYPPVGRRSGH
jgi:very-short-patch-repair endonuclease